MTVDDLAEVSELDLRLVARQILQEHESTLRILELPYAADAVRSGVIAKITNKTEWEVAIQWPLTDAVEGIQSFNRRHRNNDSKFNKACGSPRHGRNTSDSR